MTAVENPLQLDTLRLYRLLTATREDWVGALILCCGPGCAASGIPTAVSIAGGATLAIDADAAAMKSAMRAGQLDFVVNTLDEALRTLKNEIRQRKPLSVGLVADVESALHEMVERGVQPDLLLIGPHQPAQAILPSQALSALQATGMPLRSMSPDDQRPDEVYLPSANSAERRALDARLLATLSVDDLVRRRWLQRLPNYLREAPTDGRWMWLTADERTQLDV